MPTSIAEATSRDSEQNGRQYFDKIEQAAELKITTRTLEQWMKRGLVPFYKIGRTVRFDPAAVQAHFEATHRVGGRR